MSPFIYVIASAIAVFPMAIAFKLMIDPIKTGQVPYEKNVRKFLIAAFIIEIIPIIIIIYAFSQQATVAGMDELIVPGLLVIVCMAVCAFFIFLQSMVDTPKDQKQQLLVFALIAISLANAIPIVSIVGLFMMLA